ncbi:glutathione S-transferase N-terminal domain-containing protein, partial [Escherichia coli]
MGAPFTLFVDSQFLSPYAMSAYVALTEKQLPFEVRMIDLDAGEQRMQPYQCRALTARVPALTHGDFNLTESTAIAEY